MVSEWSWGPKYRQDRCLMITLFTRRSDDIYTDETKILQNKPLQLKTVLTYQLFWNQFQREAEYAFVTSSLKTTLSAYLTYYILRDCYAWPQPANRSKFDNFHCTSSTVKDIFDFINRKSKFRINIISSLSWYFYILK